MAQDEKFDEVPIRYLSKFFCCNNETRCNIIRPDHDGNTLYEGNFPQSTLNVDSFVSNVIGHLSSLNVATNTT